jgi:hypothetical protein
MEKSNMFRLGKIYQKFLLIQMLNDHYDLQESIKYLYDLSKSSRKLLKDNYQYILNGCSHGFKMQVLDFSKYYKPFPL